MSMSREEITRLSGEDLGACRVSYAYNIQNRNYRNEDYRSVEGGDYRSVSLSE
jgi:hypothetical protein